MTTYVYGIEGYFIIIAQIHNKKKYFLSEYLPYHNNFENMFNNENEKIFKMHNSDGKNIYTN